MPIHIERRPLNSEFYISFERESLFPRLRKDRQKEPGPGLRKESAVSSVHCGWRRIAEQANRVLRVHIIRSDANKITEHRNIQQELSYIYVRDPTSQRFSRRF
jgi:hypothetical protein